MACLIKDKTTMILVNDVHKMINAGAKVNTVNKTITCKESTRLVPCPKLTLKPLKLEEFVSLVKNVINEEISR